MRNRLLTTWLLLAALLAACTSGTIAPSLTESTVSTSEIEVGIGTDESATISVQLRAADGTPLARAGVEVTFTTTAGQLGATTVQTNASGVASTTLTPPATGDLDVEAVVTAYLGDEVGPDVVIASVTVVFTTQVPDAESSVLTASVLNLYIGSEDESNVTVQLKNVLGSDVTLADVAITVTTTAGDLEETLLSTDADGVATTVLTPVATNVDDASVTATISAYLGDTTDPEFLIDTVDVTFLLQPVTISISDGTFTYDGDPQTLAVTFDPAGASTSFDVTYSDDGGDLPGAPTNAGTYTVTVTRKSPSAYTGSNSATLTVDPRTLVLSDFFFADKVYDGGAGATLSATLDTTNVVAGDDVCLGPDCSNPSLVGLFQVDSGGGVYVTSNIVGLYGSGPTTSGIPNSRVIGTIQLGGADAANYVLTQPIGFAQITQRPLQLTATADNKVYDGDADATLTSPVLTTVLPQDVSGVSVTASFDSAAAGTEKTVTATLEGARSANYYIETGGSLTADITPRPIKITADNKSVTYGTEWTDGSSGTAFTVAGTGATESGLVVGESSTAWSVTLDSSQVACSNVTTYLIVPSGLTGAGSTNYEPTYVNGTLTVNALQLTLTGSISASNKQYDGSTSATVNSSGLGRSGVVCSDTVSVNAGSVGSFSSKDVGTSKTVTLSGISLTGADAGNYTLNTTSATTTADITKRRTQLQIDNAATLMYDGSTALPLVVSVTNPAPSDSNPVAYDATYAYKGPTGTDAAVGVNVIREAGVYEVTLSIKSTETRYLLVDGSDVAAATQVISVTVAKRPIVITGASATRTYVQPNPGAVVDASSTKQLGKDDAFEGTFAITGSGDAGASYPLTLGTVTVVRGGVDQAANYTITIVAGAQVAVTKANVDFMLDNADSGTGTALDPYLYTHTGSPIGLEFSSSPSGVIAVYTPVKIAGADGCPLSETVTSIQDVGRYQLTVEPSSAFTTNYTGTTTLTLDVGTVGTCSDPTGGATYDDPIGDNVLEGLDLVSMSFAFGESGLTVTLTFNESVSSEMFVGAIEVDVDGDGSTGVGGTLGLFCPESSLGSGVDSYIEFPFDDGTFDGTGTVWTVLIPSSEFTLEPNEVSASAAVAVGNPVDGPSDCVGPTATLD